MSPICTLYIYCNQVETDAKKLVNQVCGANYVTGSDPILIKVRRSSKLKCQTISPITSLCVIRGRFSPLTDAYFDRSTTNECLNYIWVVFAIDEISLLRQFLQEDSEYPDWLWTLEVKRPLPPLEEQDPNTKEYWLQVVVNYSYKILIL